MVNGLGTMSLIEIALEHSARFLYASTSEIYGDPLVHPQPGGLTLGMLIRSVKGLATMRGSVLARQLSP